jgi:transketolase
VKLSFVPYEELERVRRLDADPHTRAALFATLCRINTLYMIKKAGSGHVGTSFSCMDVLSWLFLEEMDHTVDRYFSSKGHDAPALYSVLIGMGMLDFDNIHSLRRLGGLPGHPDVSVPHMVTNTGSLGMGISKAKGMVLANRIQGKRGRIFVLTGDGELQEGQLWESLISASNLGLGEITAIVDHNKIQSDTWVSQTSDLGDIEAKFQAFGWEVGRCDGNDIGAFSLEFQRVQQAHDRPKVIIADTLKGKGVSFMEPASAINDTSLYRFHSGAPDDDLYAAAMQELFARANMFVADIGEDILRIETVDSVSATAPTLVQKLIPAYSETLIEQAENHPELVALDGDLVLDTGLIPFRERFPERFIECGIAEQDMVSQAGGMALNGLLPVVHSFACFLSDRPNEQIYNNATEHTKIVYVGSLAGLIPGGPGHSHQSVRDISALAGVPGLVMIEPSNEAETKLAVEFCVESTEDSSYLRLTSIPLDIPYTLPANYKLALGQGVDLTQGDDAILFGYGPSLLSQAFWASELLAGRGIRLRIVNLPWLNQVDGDWLRSVVEGYDHVLTLDNHYIVGGQGDVVLSALAESGLKKFPRAKKLGVREVPVSGTNDEVLRAHRLDAQSLAEDIQRFMSNAS